MNIILFDSLGDENFLRRGSRECDHITKVLKLSAGDSFRAGVWGESKGTCRILSADDSGVRFTYARESDPIRKLPIVMVISEIRPICMRRVLRFAGECGLSSLIITRTELGDENYLKSSLYNTGEHLKLLRDGAEISADSARCDVLFASSVEEAIERAEDLGVTSRMLLDKRATEMLSAPAGDGLSAVAIGGERGFTEREVNAFRGAGYCLRSLGKRIIRAEESAILSVYPWLGR